MTRLTPALLDILIVLSKGPRHGYGIAVDAANLTQPPGKSMGPATLYTSLQKLLDEGLVQILHAKPGDDPRRKTYEITPQGGWRLGQEARALQQRLDAVAWADIPGKATS